MAFALICEQSIQLLPVVDTAAGAQLYFDGIGESVTLPYCSSGWVQVAHVPPFDSTQIDPSVVAALIGAGFLLYLTPWAAAYGFSALLKLLR